MPNTPASEPMMTASSPVGISGEATEKGMQSAKTISGGPHRRVLVALAERNSVSQVPKSDAERQGDEEGKCRSTRRSAAGVQP